MIRTHSCKTIYLSCLVLTVISASAQQPSLPGGHVDLGEENEQVWLVQKEQRDGQTIVAERGDRQGRGTNDSPEISIPPVRNTYMYFDLGGDFLGELPAGTVATVTVTYWDEGRDSFTIEYDSFDPNGGPLEGAYTSARAVRKRNTMSWLEAAFVLPDARFANRQNGNCDFRLNAGGDGDELLDRVEVSLDPPAPLRHPDVPDAQDGGRLWRAIDFNMPDRRHGVKLVGESRPPIEWYIGRPAALLSEPLALDIDDNYLTPVHHRDVFVTVVYHDNDATFTLRYEDPTRGWVLADLQIEGTGSNLFRRAVFRLDDLLGHTQDEKDIEIVPLSGRPAIDRVFIQVAPGPHAGEVTLDMRQDRSFSLPTVLTYYFYWYDVTTGYHMYDYGDPNDDALQDHPTDMERFSFKFVDWHDREMDDLIAAGIDVILPVYWGTTDAQKAFSIQGLEVLSEALVARESSGRRSPRVGLIFDTSTLQHGERVVRESADAQTDLSTDEGKDFFFKHIRDFFSLIPPRHWATVDGRPLVWLYSSPFAYGFGPDLGPYVRERFRHHFGGLEMFLVADVTWGDIGQDATSAWGAAFGIRVYDVAAVGPGYDDRAVPNRTTPQMDREDGAFYRRNWEAALESGKPWVIIETWNEFHEGTDIADSREYGRQYMDITREFADRLHRTGVSDWDRQSADPR